MGLYVAAMPVGQAIGFGGSGTTASIPSLGWRSVYGFETILAASLLVLWIATVRVPEELLTRVATVADEGGEEDEDELGDSPDSLLDPGPPVDHGTLRLLSRHSSSSSATAEATARSALVDEWDGFRRASSMPGLFTTPAWWALTVGFGAQLYVIGVLTLFGPDFFAGALHMKPESASLAFGAGTVGAGLLGSVLGGIVGDLGRRRGRAQLEYQAWICAVTAAIAGPLIVSGILWGGSSRALVFSLMFTGEAFIFASLAPLNACTLGVAETRISSAAMSYSILAAHLMGDVPSPLIAGAAIDAAVDSGTDPLTAQRKVLAASSAALLVGALAWSAAALLLRRPTRPAILLP
jgi:hypothetical protein